MIYKIDKVETVRCSNCGNLAERVHYAHQLITRDQCDACDYLLVTSWETGNVMEAHAPGLSVASPSLGLTKPIQLRSPQLATSGAC